MPTGGICLAHWDEDTSWTTALSGHPLTKNLRITRVKAKGQEAGAYCEYVLKYWSELPDVVIFLQADPHIHVRDGGNIYQVLQTYLEMCERSMPIFVPLGVPSITTDEDSLVARVQDRPRKPGIEYSNMPLKDACRHLFDKECPKQILVSFGALIMTSKYAIQDRGKLFWLKLRDYVSHDEKSFEVAVMEKLWSLVFYPDLFHAVFDHMHLHPVWRIYDPQWRPNPDGINVAERTLFWPWVWADLDDHGADITEIDLSNPK